MDHARKIKQSIQELLGPQSAAGKLLAGGVDDLVEGTRKAYSRSRCSRSKLVTEGNRILRELTNTHHSLLHAAENEPGLSWALAKKLKNNFLQKEANKILKEASARLKEKYGEEKAKEWEQTNNRERMRQRWKSMQEAAKNKLAKELSSSSSSTPGNRCSTITAIAADTQPDM